MPDWSSAASPSSWRLRGRTARAALMLGAARVLVRAVPLRWWRTRLGPGAGRRAARDGDRLIARGWARHVERAARRLPGTSRCLPRAMALSWLLRRADLAHALVIAARPAGARGSGGEADALHAWVEHGGERIIGDLPGPWLEVLRLGDGAAPDPVARHG